MENTRQLARLMKMSWEIQRTKKRDRSRALQAAWAIMQNEEVTVYYLVKRYSPKRPPEAQPIGQMGLFACT